MAAFSSAASFSVVELCTAAELDTATSALFCHDDSEAGGGSFSWPEAVEKTMSKITRPVTLRAFCDAAGGLQCHLRLR